MACFGRREHLLLAQRARDRRATAQDAAEGRRRGRLQVRELRPPADRGRDQPTASGRGTVARNRSADTRGGARSGDDVPARPQLPAIGRGSRVDRYLPHLARSLPRALRASQRWQPSRRGAAATTRQPARDVQQRLQARGLRRRLRRVRPGVRPAQGRPGDVDRISQRHHRRARLDRRSRPRSGHRVRAPEPAV